MVHEKEYEQFSGCVVSFRRRVAFTATERACVAALVEISAILRGRKNKAKDMKRSLSFSLSLGFPLAVGGRKKRGNR